METGRNYIVLLTLLVFLPLCLSDGMYIKVDVYFQKGCEDQRYLSTWFINTTRSKTQCSLIPFQIPGYLSYDFERKKINFTGYEGHYHCDTYNPSYSFTVGFGVCFDGFVDEQVSFKMDFADKLPFERVSPMEYIAINKYKDEECSVRYNIIDTFSNRHSTNQTKRFEPLLYNHCQYGDNALSNIYCSPDWFAEEVYFCPTKTIFGWRYFPNAKDGECIVHQNHTNGIIGVEGHPSSYLDSISLYYPPSFQKICMDHKTFEKLYMKYVPEQSTASFSVQSYTFDPDCGEGKEDYQEIRRLDECIRGEISYSTNDTFLRIMYVHRNCSVFLNLYLSFKPDWCPCIQDECMHWGVDVLGFERYFQIKFTNWPFFPDQVTRLISSDVKCGDDLTAMKKGLHMRELLSINNNECLNSYVYGELLPLPFTKSLRLECDNGRLYGRNYTDFVWCYADYEFIMGHDVCFEVNNEYFHITCIPKYCGNRTEFDPKVCHGRGTCVSSDLSTYPVCECFVNGYYGELCNNWDCDGTGKNEKDVCNGRGECPTPNNCVCDRGFSGQFCENDDKKIARKKANEAAVNAIVYTSIGFAFCVFPLIAIFLQCVCWTSICCCLCLGCDLGTIIVGVSSAYFVNQERLKKYLKLKDFDALYQEQLDQEDTTVAHLKINKNLFEILYEEIKIKKMIGKGGSDALVFLSTWKGQIVAFKCFKTKKLCSSQDRFDAFEIEVNLLVNINHPYIIRFFGATLKPPRVGIVMEYCENGELLDFVIMEREKRQDVSYPLNEKFRMLREIIAAMGYLHSRNIIHRDLKSENILVDRSETCKLMDFGISRVIQKNTDSNEKTKRIGTNIYMAPEIMVGNYGTKCDVFSFSILAWILLTENLKPYGVKDYQIEFRVANDPNCRPDIDLIDDELHQQNLFIKYRWVKRVLEKCWSHDEHERLSFEQLEQVFQKEEMLEKSLEKGGSINGEKKSFRDAEDDEIINEIKVIE